MVGLMQGVALAILSIATLASGFAPAPSAFFGHASQTSRTSLRASLRHSTRLRGGAISMSTTTGPRTIVEKDVEAVGETLCDMVAKAATSAIADKGHFAFAIPGGSILNMLVQMNTKYPDLDWSKATMAYVNHRCVPLDDETSTHFKARNKFLNQWIDKGLNCVLLDGTTDAEAEAASYTKKVEEIPSSTLPRSASGLPVFDLMLIGVGLDGHIGSLYPDSPQVAEKEKWVIPRVTDASSSITLSLPVIAAANDIVVASAGKSEKYPEGKAVAMKRALQGDETAASFPASALAGSATWILDEGAAAQLTL
eukprot:CAMPEP_0196720402 /NCGR_PEP_ID=MMETSP1091-20130531/3206_1 /TAXON_ID=302021 /ORGANISM="Rhodomonas sp., Strain CCMP768" /LENGTH=309 /DNA_ID=CAMNT_0042061631 /DNA_START=17 /DNA_END=946 /DNA_ORIENTATION=-